MGQPKALYMYTELLSMQQGAYVQLHLPSCCHREGCVTHYSCRATIEEVAGPPAQLFASLRVQAYDCASLGKGGPDAPLTVQRQAVR